MRRLSLVLPSLFCVPMTLAAVPVDLHPPASMAACTQAKPCPVAVLSPGYGLSGSDYAFITQHLNGMGYLVIALRDSAGGARLDPDLPVGRQIQAMAKVAAQSISAALDENAAQSPQFDWRQVLLVGHSLGGDSSAQFAAEHPERVTGVISLDNRRVALPRSTRVHVLTIRASDEPPDPGVLPDADEQRRFGTCVVHIDGARHFYLQDAGSAQLKARITSIIDTFLAPASSPKYACARDQAAVASML